MPQATVFKKAFDWLQRETGENFLSADEYCPTRDIFQAKLDRFRLDLDAEGFSDTALLVAVAGEIGNNVFDHNLGNWRDVPGAYFKYDKLDNAVIVADRGQGIKRTISRVKPDVKDDQEALQIAFTKMVSGRAPEQRGNGLKFVRIIIGKQNWRLDAYSGWANLRISKTGELTISSYDSEIKGTIIIIHL